MMVKKSWDLLNLRHIGQPRHPGVCRSPRGAQGEDHVEMKILQHPTILNTVNDNSNFNDSPSFECFSNQLIAKLFSNQSHTVCCTFCIISLLFIICLY